MKGSTSHIFKDLPLFLEAAHREFLRLTNEADSLVHFQVPKDDANDPDLEIEYDPYESLMDGKTKYV